jgi:hypothetical protein
MRNLVFSIRPPVGQTTFKDGSKLRFRTAYAPQDAPAKIYDNRGDIAEFKPAETRRGHTLNLRTGAVSPQTSQLPDRVIIGSHGYTFERGICERVRWMPPDSIEFIAAKDAEIAGFRALIEECEREKQAAYDDAYVRGTKLRKSDLISDEARDLLTRLQVIS